MKLLIVLLLSSFSSNTFASIVYYCSGNSSKEYLTFVVDGGEGIQLDIVSSALCGGYTHLGKDDEGVWLTQQDATPKSKVLKYDTWEGNWGFWMSIPRSIGEGTGNLKNFTVKYVFDYNDIAELTLKRTLTCRKKVK